MDSTKVSAVLFAKDLVRVATFYSVALEMKRVHCDADHWILDREGFRLVVHQIPKRIADSIAIEQPPERRVWGSIRLDYPIRNVPESRALAKSLGGDIDQSPPEWADRSSNFFFGYDPEGNQFGVNEHPLTTGDRS
jgi:hypothetical protein